MQSQQALQHCRTLQAVEARLELIHVVPEQELLEEELLEELFFKGKLLRPLDLLGCTTSEHARSTACTYMYVTTRTRTQQSPMGLHFVCAPFLT
jgi:hypothetical protein